MESQINYTTTKTEERVKETEIQKEDRTEGERPLQFACLASLIYSSFI